MVEAVTGTASSEVWAAIPCVPMSGKGLNARALTGGATLHCQFLAGQAQSVIPGSPAFRAHCSDLPHVPGGWTRSGTSRGRPAFT